MARSGKVGFCLLNTSQVDLHFGRPAGSLVPPWKTTCHGRRPLQRLDPGWGDLYQQRVAGQALDVGALPNGAYTLEVAVNPAGRLTEAARDNNVAARGIVLGGRPGHHTLTVPPVGGVYTAAELRPAPDWEVLGELAGALPDLEDVF